MMLSLMSNKDHYNRRAMSNQKDDKKQNLWAHIVLVALIVTFIGLLIARCNKNMGPTTDIMLAVTGVLILLLGAAMVIYSSSSSPGSSKQACPCAAVESKETKDRQYGLSQTQAAEDLIENIVVDGSNCCFNGDYGSAEWDSGFKHPEYDPAIDGREKWLAQTGADTMAVIADQQVVPELEVPPPGECCPMRTDWQGAFLGMPTTFITPPTCAVAGFGSSGDNPVAAGPCDVDPTNRDKRPYFRRLEDEYYLRSRKNAEIWDPYKHMTARQMYMQFLASGLTNRKAFYERPIEQLEEATCFQNTVQQKNSVCGNPPLVQTNVQVPDVCQI